MKRCNMVLAGCVYLLGSVVPIAAQAEDSWGVSLGLDKVGPFDPKTIHALYEKTLIATPGKPYSLSFQGRLGTGISDDQGVSVDYTVGGYFRGGWYLIDAFEPFFTVGMTYVKASVEGLGSDTDSDLSIGFGLAYHLSKKTAVVIEKIDYTDDFEYQGLNLGFVQSLR